MHLTAQILFVFAITYTTHSYRFDFIVNLTKSLSEVHSFHTFVVFRDEFIITRNVDGPHLENELQKRFNIPLICCNARVPNSTRLRQILNVNSLGIVIMNKLTDPIRKTSDVILTKLHDMKLIFVLTQSQALVTENELNTFFWWCWNVNFLNLIVTFSLENDTRNEVFTYNPFPDRIDIKNLTKSNVKEYFWNKVANVKGYRFVSPVFVDEPMVMKFHDEIQNRTHITGTAGRLYTEFLWHINATFFVLNVSNSSLHLHQRHVVRLTVSKVIDMGIHPYTYLLPYETDGSYPIAHTNACLILPVVPEIDRSYYIIYAFNHQMWTYTLGLLIAFLSIELIANYTCERRFIVGESILSCIMGTINRPMQMPSSSPSAIGRWRSITLINLLLSFTGFFLSNLYVGALTSLFSTTVYGNQPESIEDILATRLEILLLDYEDIAYFGTKLLPEALRTRVRITDPDTLANYRNKLNTSYAYIVKEERWKMISYQQVRLWKPIFKIARDFCIPNMFLSFPIQFDSPFYEVLKSFTLNADSAGLYSQWADSSNHEAKEAGVICIMKEHGQRPMALSLDHFRLIFTFVGTCFVICFGCLLGEQFVAGRLA